VRAFVLVRHGQSVFNAENRFTGWIDSPLTLAGAEEAQRAGRRLRSSGFRFDRIYSSVLVRCVESARIIRNELGESAMPITTSWRLNERHYGALQGLSKSDLISQFGAEQVHVWRRSHAARPPAATSDDNRRLAWIAQSAIAVEDVPLTESLADTVVRVVPYWDGVIAPAIRLGESILIVAHGNSIRALLMHIGHISAEAIVDLNIPTGIPEVYELTDDLQPLRRRYLVEEA